MSSPSASRSLIFKFCSAAFVAFPGLIWSADVQKDLNVADLNLGGSWVGGVAPTSADVAVWGSTVTGANSSTLAAAAAWQGIRVASPGGLVTLNLGAQLDLGAAGIDLSAATQDMLITGVGQTINFDSINLNVNVGTGRTLTIQSKFGNGDSFTKSGDGLLSFQGTQDNGGTVGTVSAGILELAKDSNAGTHALGGGTHTVNGGTLRLAGTGGDQIYTTAVVNVNGGIFDFNGRSEGWAALGGAAAGTITNNGASPATMTLGENNSGGTTFAGVISNGTSTLAVSKVGSGVQTFSGTANTYSGGTTVTGGILAVTADGSLGAAASGLTLDGGTLQNNNSTLVLGASRGITLGNAGGIIRSGWGQSTTVNGIISGTGSLTIANDSGTVFVTNSGNNYSGNTVIGAVGSGNDARLSLGASNVLPNTALQFASAGTAVFNLNGFDESVASIATIGTGIGNISNSVATEKLLTITGNAVTTYNGSINSNVRLVYSGGGELTLTGTTDNSGGRITVNTGTVILAKTSSGSVHGAGGDGHVINSGGTLKLGGTGGDQFYTTGDLAVNTGGTFDLNERSEALDSLTGGGSITNTGAGASVLTIGDSGAASSYNGVVSNGTGGVSIVKKDGGVWIPGTTNTYQGSTSILGGYIQAGADATFGAVPGSPTTNIILNNGGIKNSDSNTVLAANRSVDVQAGGGTFTAGWGKTLQVDGVISGAGAVNINQDSGTVVLTGANSYAGATTVGTSNVGFSGTGAKLLVNGNQSAATGTTTVLNNGILGGMGTLGGAAIINTGGTLSPGGNAGATLFGTGTLNIAGSLSLDSAAIVSLQLVGATSNAPGIFGSGSALAYLTTNGDPAITGNHDFVKVASSASAGGVWQLNLDFTGYTPAPGDLFDVFDFSGGTLGAPQVNVVGGSLGTYTLDTTGLSQYGVIAVVPEPANLALLTAGALVLGRRRRKA